MFVVNIYYGSIYVLFSIKMCTLVMYFRGQRRSSIKLLKWITS